MPTPMRVIAVEAEILRQWEAPTPRSQIREKAKTLAREPYRATTQLTKTGATS